MTWVNKAKSKEAKRLQPPALQMGRPRPRKHGDGSGAKAQTLRIISQEKFTPPRTHQDTTPRRKERQVQRVMECPILLSLPLGADGEGMEG